MQKPCWDLLVQSQQWKNQSIVQNLETQERRSGVFIVNFEQILYIVLLFI